MKIPVLTKVLVTVIIACGCLVDLEAQSAWQQEVIRTLQPLILEQSGWALRQQPITITAFPAARSEGGRHDFYSEGDYWWPDPDNPDGPYIHRDGETNPDNFVAHRHAMVRLSRIVGALASAYKITGEEKYVKAAFSHLRAWFIDSATRMNPSLRYAQAIHGRVNGRSIGIIDTIHLMEVAQGVNVMQHASGVDPAEVHQIKGWFDAYLTWLTTDPFGKQEMHWNNNHGTCWAIQAAAFARLTDNQAVLDTCRRRYKTVLLPDQMAEDGSFPLELRRTKPYGYSLFNLDAMAMLCQILSDEDDNLWKYQAGDKTCKKGIEFLFPFVRQKSQWPYPKDVMYWDAWPVAQPFLVFGALAYHNREWLEEWRRLDHAPGDDEVLRNLPVRNPVIWMD